jgi:hypothetical protein
VAKDVVVRDASRGPAGRPSVCPSWDKAPQAGQIRPWEAISIGSGSHRRESPVVALPVAALPEGHPACSAASCARRGRGRRSNEIAYQGAPENWRG